MVVNAPPETTIESGFVFYGSWDKSFSLEIYLVTVASLSPSIKYYLISSERSLQEYPMLIAVSILSPVKTQTLIPAFLRSSMTSPTLSYSLSSIAVTPITSISYSIVSSNYPIKEALFYSSSSID